jgi:glycosyltransferase involved in cell wall biosynthesis
MMKVSIVIAVYKNIAALELILKALEKQTYTNFEVIVAEDDNNQATREFIAEVQKNSRLTIKHVHQEEDCGFRKNKILNRSIVASEGEYLIFTDGDCVPHRNFVQAYMKVAKENNILFGRRVMLSEELTKRLYKEKNLELLSLSNLIRFGATGIKYSFNLPGLMQKRKIGIYGCNWGLFKKQIVAVNGYDEDYVTAGVGEDADIEWRLLALGLQLFSIRFSACQYHLHHPLNYSNTDVNIGFRMLTKKKKKNNIVCKNGIEKLP